MSPAKIIDGKLIAEKVRESLRDRINRLKKMGITPGLAVILVGDDHASHVYVSMKEKAFHQMDLLSETFRKPANISQEEMVGLIHQLNTDNRFHGILIQLPLPKHLDEQTVLDHIDDDKDADGLLPASMGKMVLGMEGPLPCTPHGMLMLLKHSGIETSGKHAVVIGRSNIVGKPIANLLLQKREMGDCTVTICHSRTKNLAAICQQADILIAAIGKPEFVDRNFIKKGAVVIDVGVNRVDAPNTKKGYKLVGDVNYADVEQIASAITPVPGGVGPMTITMLIYNTVYLAEQRLKTMED
ncbi:MAG: bifunctional methylenetetrahydrofolate dehydrogenase/methenyltetrahydrofolate cyclohydrolase FolD [Candidatus Marinimicrobia bacterium]|nr:bifunctional methylenetetrahydrofolate dehydrogenase/methenyltetrahydrofolate cyclohydrolase FolD [Candidatus Neomarinimicrobiota bacterium]